MTPALASASISAVRPNASGCWTAEIRSTGWAPAAIVPDRLIRVPSGEADTAMLVALPAATVLTVDRTWYGATCGRQLSFAGLPGVVAVVSRSITLSLTINGVGAGSRLAGELNSRESIATFPCTRVMPDRRTWRAISSSPASGSSGVSVAPGTSSA